MGENNDKWGPPKEGAKPLTIKEKIFGPPDQGTPFIKKILGFYDAVLVAPAVWVRENVVEKLRGPEYYWYHRRFRRVPTIDECYFHDVACRFEANQQMARDKLVEENLVYLLRQRAIDCAFYEGYGTEQLDPNTKCGELKVDYEKAAASLFVKYGEMRGNPLTAEQVLMKQKHRLIWERRHGPLPTSGAFTLD